MPEVKGDGKIRFGCNYRRLHVYTQSDVEVAADKFVSATLVYLNNTNHVPVRWQRRLADPAILEAKDIRHHIIDTNGIRIDMENKVIVRKNLLTRIYGWQKVLRMCRDFQANLNDVLTICPNTSEEMLDDGFLTFDDIRTSYQSWRGGFIVNTKKRRISRNKVFHNTSLKAHRSVREMDKLFDNLFIRPFMAGGNYHGSEENGFRGKNQELPAVFGCY